MKSQNAPKETKNLPKSEVLEIPNISNITNIKSINKFYTKLMKLDFMSDEVDYKLDCEYEMKITYLVT